MKDNIKPIIELVENLESDFNNKDQGNNESNKLLKDRAYSILSGLKRNQDNPENEEYDDVLEDLIVRVIEIIGQL